MAGNDDIVAQLCDRLSDVALYLHNAGQRGRAGDVKFAIAALAERDATIERLEKVAEQAQEDRRTLRYEVACLRARAETAERDLAEARAEVERKDAALRRADQFITNGIELGFIRMPDAGVPDPAHETPGIIRAALAEGGADGDA